MNHPISELTVAPFGAINLDHFEGSAKMTRESKVALKPSHVCTTNVKGIKNGKSKALRVLANRL